METREERALRIDRRAFLSRIFRPFDRLSAAIGPKKGDTTVFLCKCRGKTSINMEELATFVKRLRVKDVILHNELCEIDGRAYFKSIATENPGNILVATCTKKMTFNNIATRLNYPVSFLYILELRELCGWAHDDQKRATEKAKRIVASKLASIHARALDKRDPSVALLAVSKALEPSDIRTLSGNMEGCPADEKICSICGDFCPQKAVLYSEQGIRIDRRSCNVCGICAKTCPQNLMEVTPRYDTSLVLELMLTDSHDILRSKKREETLTAEIVAFVCEYKAKTSLIRLGLLKEKYPADILPVFMRCLCDLTPNFILEAFGRGAEGVIMMGCDDCLYDSQDYIGNLKSMMEGIFDGSILEGRLAIIRSDGKDSDKILETINKFHIKIGQKKRMNVQYIENAEKEKRHGFIDLLSVLQRQTDLKGTIKAHEMFPFGFVDVATDSCDLCLQCAKICPFNALEAREKTLTFNHVKCTGCGLCVDACEKGLLDLKHEIRVKALANGAMLIKDKSESIENRET